MRTLGGEIAAIFQPRALVSLVLSRLKTLAHLCSQGFESFELEDLTSFLLTPRGIFEITTQVRL